MSLPSSLQSELEAVNVILAAAEEAPVQALELSGLYPLDLAKQCLAEASRVVQSPGWAFNSEDEVELVPNGSNEITLAPNVLKVDVPPEYDRKPVQRGIRLYDAKAHTYTFTKPVKASVVYLLGWDELPQAARYYITIKAARIMQSRTAVSEATYRYTDADEASAFYAMSEHEAATGNANMLADSADTAAILMNHSTYPF